MVIDIEIFIRLLGDVPIKHALADGYEQAPDEDVLLAARDLDIRRLSFSERNLPFSVVDVEVEVGIAIEVAGNRFVQREVFVFEAGLQRVEQLVALDASLMGNARPEIGGLDHIMDLAAPLLFKGVHIVWIEFIPDAERYQVAVGLNRKASM